MDLGTLTPAEIDQRWIQALTPVLRRQHEANAFDATAGRYERAGSAYAQVAAMKRQRAHELRVEAANLRAEIDVPFMAEWEARGGWTRAYIVPDGHIHRSTHCHSLHPTTVISWLPDQSGLSEEEIVKLAGTMACTHCYPSAPVAELKAAEAAAKKATQCPGSGTYDHDSSGLRYYSPRARCNHCGQTTSVTSTGKLRAHKPKAQS